MTELSSGTASLLRSWQDSINYLRSLPKPSDVLSQADRLNRIINLQRKINVIKGVADYGVRWSTDQVAGSGSRSLLSSGARQASQKAGTRVVAEVAKKAGTQVVRQAGTSAAGSGGFGAAVGNVLGGIGRGVISRGPAFLAGANPVGVGIATLVTAAAVTAGVATLAGSLAGDDSVDSNFTDEQIRQRQEESAMQAGSRSSTGSGYYAILVGGTIVSVHSVEAVEGGELQNCDFRHGGLCPNDEADIEVIGERHDTFDDAAAAICGELENVRIHPTAGGKVADYRGTEVTVDDFSGLNCG
jgi:hypothetical protein